MTVDQWARKLRTQKDRLIPELANTTKGLARSANKLSKEKMTEGIYALPIPKRPRSGKPQWRRTGHLRRSETFEVRGPVEFVTRNTAAYAEPRHEAGKPGRRKVRYVSHWQDETREVMQPLAVELWRETIRDVLGVR
ncbi:MAG TPA: hypothetical protein VIM84_07835 [Gemmatimonadales bacterium]